MRLEGRRDAILVDEGVEDLEYRVTLMRLREEGADSSRSVATPSPGTGSERPRRPRRRDRVLAADGVDGLGVPGGWAPDKLRRDPPVIGVTRACAARRQIAGIICHGGFVAISAGSLRVARSTGPLGIRDDLVDAGTTSVDEAAFRDGNIVWGRVVADIPAPCRELVEAFATT